MKHIKSIDILKVLGLLGIMIAHVGAPGWAIQLRGFDVILLIAISVYLYFTLSKDREESYVKYVWKRIKRLVLPTWLFLSIFFLIALVMTPYPFSIREVFGSFLLKDGIGYVWIVRIYLIVALLLPPMKFLLKKPIKYSWLYLGWAGGLIALQEILFQAGLFSKNFFTWDILAYILPCIAIILCVFWGMKASTKSLCVVSALTTIVFLAMMGFYIIKTGQFQNTSIAKYPFRTYYIAYALAMIGWLAALMRNRNIVNKLWNKTFEFISIHSFWIYLWHIPFIFVLDKWFGGLYWIIKLVIAIGGACIFVLAQSYLVKKLKANGVSKEVLKILEG